jgi:DTW domain-containing protein
MTLTGREPRRLCERCARPESVCLCSAIVSVPTRTRVVILQHPRESIVPINTARLAELGLPNAERHVGIEFDLEQIVPPGSAPPILLYPGAGVRDLSLEPPSGPVTLVVIDGTWWQAQKLVKKNPAVAALPRYSLAPKQPSRYRIRREPAAHCVSTIEAVALALAALERDTPGIERILQPFEAMVEHQLRYAERRATRHVAKSGGVKKARWPAALADRAGDLVVAYAEANAWPRDTALGADAEIVHLAAERVVSGERFEAFIAPRRALSPSFTHHTGIAPERVLGADAWPEFLERFRAFLRPTDVLGSWGHYWAESLRREGAELPERLDLRLIARRFLREKSGEVEACARRLGEVPPEPWATGRTGRRAAGAVAVARGLLRAARGELPPNEAE